MSHDIQKWEKSVKKGFNPLCYNSLDTIWQYDTAEFQGRFNPLVRKVESAQSNSIKS